MKTFRLFVFGLAVLVGVCHAQTSNQKASPAPPPPSKPIPLELQVKLLKAQSANVIATANAAEALRNLNQAKQDLEVQRSAFVTVLADVKKQLGCADIASNENGDPVCVLPPKSPPPPPASK